MALSMPLRDHQVHAHTKRTPEPALVMQPLRVDHEVGGNGVCTILYAEQRRVRRRLAGELRRVDAFIEVAATPVGVARHRRVGAGQVQIVLVRNGVGLPRLSVASKK